MPSHLSTTAKALLILLNNVNELIVLSSDRTNARKEVEALKIYATNNGFSFPPDTESKIDNFLAILLDSKPYTLTSIIMDISQDVLLIDRKS